MRADGHGGDEAHNGEKRDDDPERADDTLCALGQIAGHLDGEPECSVKRERDECDKAADDGVPVEYAGAYAGLPVGPERQKEVAVGL